MLTVLGWAILGGQGKELVLLLLLLLLVPVLAPVILNDNPRERPRCRCCCCMWWLSLLLCCGSLESSTLLLSDGAWVVVEIGDGYCKVVVAVRGGLIVVELDRRKETEEMKEASSDKKTKKDGRMTSDQDCFLYYPSWMSFKAISAVHGQHKTDTQVHITWSHISHHANYFMISCYSHYFFLLYKGHPFGNNRLLLRWLCCSSKIIVVAVQPI